MKHTHKVLCMCRVLLCKVNPRQLTPACSRYWCRAAMAGSQQHRGTAFAYALLAAKHTQCGKPCTQAHTDTTKHALRAWLLQCNTADSRTTRHHCRPKLRRHNCAQADCTTPPSPPRTQGTAARVKRQVRCPHSTHKPGPTPSQTR